MRHNNAPKRITYMHSCCHAPEMGSLHSHRRMRKMTQQSAHKNHKNLALVRATPRTNTRRAKLFLAVASECTTQGCICASQTSHSQPCQAIAPDNASKISEACRHAVYVSKVHTVLLAIIVLTAAIHIIVVCKRKAARFADALFSAACEGQRTVRAPNPA